ncbi:helix-turn-helix domain-containing protein [Chromobacterium haemolyticum]|nr:helix-turn-helix domain-containing protein [Chromobacterium haemolyticum]
MQPSARQPPHAAKNSFQLVADTTPVDYLRSIRLNAVRRMLLNPTQAGHGVRDAAGAWGFYHLGHFAGDYRKLFGEAPSHTRARAWPTWARLPARAVWNRPTTRRTRPRGFRPGGARGSRWAGSPPGAERSGKSKRGP